MAEGSSKIWSAFSVAAGLTAVALAKKAVDTSWTVATGKKPPENPADPDVDLPEAVAFALVTGMAIGLARMLAQRRAASYYFRSTGHLPPELARDGQRP